MKEFNDPQMAEFHVQNALNEGQIYEKLAEQGRREGSESPFLVKKVFEFTNTRYQALGLEECPGGELLQTLRKKKRMSQAEARFYASGILLGLEQLHANGILFRDLKPENVLIGANGYPKLGDFGLSIDCAVPRIAAPKNFFVGTIDYCAPELFKKADFNPEHDVWALGCLLYELVIGLPPFHCQDPRKTVQKILASAPDFKMFGSELKDLKDLLLRMLVKDPKMRLKTLKEVREHAWFAKNIDFAKVKAQELKAPFLPEPRAQDEKLLALEKSPEVEAITHLFL